MQILYYDVIVPKDNASATLALSWVWVFSIGAEIDAFIIIRIYEFKKKRVTVSLR